MMEIKSEMKTFEGICKGCGVIMSVMAETQQEADRMVTEMCGCGAGKSRRNTTR